MLEPRPYQKEALNSILKEWQEGRTRQLVSLPTGCGKTIIFGLVAEAIRKRTLIIAHREELLYQAQQKLKLVYPDAKIGILKAEERGGLDAEICIASIQTATRHTEELSGKGYDLLICDEAHHAVSRSYIKVFEDLGFMEGKSDKLLLGVTATAFRGDNTGLDNVFEKIVFERSILAMIKGGYLCDVRGMSVNTGEDISCVNMQADDFAVNKLAALIDIPERNKLVADTYLEYGENRRGVVFAVKVEHALNLAAAFKERGVACEAVYGDMPTEQRQEILTRYANHELQILTNVGVLTEGWDVPDTDIILMARPTKSRGLYIQCVGRGLRIAPNKQDCLIIDFVDITKKHDICGFGTLAGKKTKDANKEKSLKDYTGEDTRTYERGICFPPDFQTTELFERSRYIWQKVEEHYKLQIMDNSSLWCRSEKEGFIACFVSPTGEVKKLSEEFLPLDYAMGVCEDYARKLDKAGYSMKGAAWRNCPATDKQIVALQKMGVDFQEGITRGEASDLLSDRLGSRATDKQIFFIKRNRLHNNPEILTKYEAMKIIGAFKDEQAVS